MTQVGEVACASTPNRSLPNYSFHPITLSIFLGWRPNFSGTDGCEPLAWNYLNGFNIQIYCWLPTKNLGYCIYMYIRTKSEYKQMVYNTYRMIYTSFFWAFACLSLLRWAKLLTWAARSRLPAITAPTEPNRASPIIPNIIPILNLDVALSIMSTLHLKNRNTAKEKFKPHQ